MKFYPSFLYTALVHLLAIFFSMLCFSLLQTYGSGNKSDRLALLQFKQGITSDTNGVLNSWNGSNHFCNWFGVSCGRRHQRVVSLDLEGHNLKGYLSPYVGNLSFLRTLNVRNNSFHRQIPSEIGNLLRLRNLSMGNNTLSGLIPSNLSRCSQLRWFVLEKNNLIGGIPQGLGNLANLDFFALAGNNLTGEIPVSLGNLSSLVFFSLADNNLVGKVPGELGRLKKLNSFSVAVNHLSGTIPPSLFNVSSVLKLFSLSMNLFEGNLPVNLGITLPNVRVFEVGTNIFSGSIPTSLCNATSLEIIDFGINKFVGQVPSSLGSLENLWLLDLSDNELVSDSENGQTSLKFVENCASLTILDLSMNNFGGSLPNFIGNMSTKLSELYLGMNEITGAIPASAENLTKLIMLSLEDNFLIGNIPPSLEKLQSLQTLSLSGNRLYGPIPPSIGNLTALYDVELSQNTLEGSIPDNIKDCKSLQVLDISHNLLNGTIPKLLPTYLTVVNLSGNFFFGHLPEEIGKLVSMNLLDVSDNSLSGEIPRSIGECQSLEILNFRGNSFQGKIPPSLSSLKGLQNMDLSQNNLTGAIPLDLQKLSLKYMNLSFNDLEGEVPTRGIFRNTSLFSVDGNEKVCSSLPELRLPKCFTELAHNGKRRAQKLVGIIASVSLFVASLSAILFIYYWRRKPKRNNLAMPSFVTEPHVEVSYRDIHRATNGFSSDNLIGSGTFGLVYKGFLGQVQRYVAIKVLKLEEKGASKSFIAECKALRSVRHRNLVKLLTYCSSLDHAGNEFKALIFEFMGNGSLENHLRTLNFIQRLNVAIDIASALHYLHDLCEGPIIHCDLKPSNILLDDSFVAHLCDFGLAELFFSINDESQSQISSIGMKGTIGYAPPEYGLGGTTSKAGDVYSFGILVLELFSGKRPTHEMFINGLNLHDFVKNALPQALFEVLDPSMLSKEAEKNASIAIIGLNEKLKGSLLSVFKVGLACSTQNPTERQKIGDAVKELHLIRSTFLGVRIYE